MSSMNKVFLCGRLGKAPELRQAGEHQVCEFTLATNEKTKNGEETQWHSVVVWGKTAEACAKYLGKGSQVLVEGKLKTRSWEKDGQKRYKTEVTARDVQFLSPKKEQPGLQGVPNFAPTGDDEFAF